MSLHSEIHLGYEIGTGAAVEIPLRHTAVTGQTQESGKTTTLEGLISRSGLKAVAYVTKRGESSFHVANPIPPYFQERADWEFVQSLLEASTDKKQDFKEEWIMRVTDGASTLTEVHEKIREYLHGIKDETPRKKGRSKGEVKERWIQKPARGLAAGIYYILDKYFLKLMPAIASLPYTTELNLHPGVNVMDLRPYEFPLQALVVRSVIDCVRNGHEHTINVIPEAWKFAPKQRGSPVRQSAEELIREGGALKNFLWIDSQDLAGVADVLMRQVGVWLFGVQRAKHEIERALDHMPEGLPARRPRPADIATLGKGQFYVCFGREMYKVYVQPAWMTAAHAEAIARGEEDVDSAREILRDFDKSSRQALPDAKLSARTMQGGPKTAGATKSFIDPGIEESGVAETNRRPVSESSAAVANSKPSAPLARAKGASTRIEDTGAAAAGVNPEEAVWKEKYEALKAEFDQLREAHDALAERIRLSEEVGETVLHAPARPLSSNGGAPSLNDIYIYVRERLAKDPGVLEIAVQQPELRVKVERKTVDFDAATLRGRLALLLSKKFFASPQNGNTAFNELKRLGFPCAKPNVYRELDKLAEFGFLTKEAAGYQAVAGMKVNIVEA